MGGGLSRRGNACDMGGKVLIYMDYSIPVKGTFTAVAQTVKHRFGGSFGYRWGEQTFIGRVVQACIGGRGMVFVA